jgi:hypothetical protein
MERECFVRLKIVGLLLGIFERPVALLLYSFHKCGSVFCVPRRILLSHPRLDRLDGNERFIRLIEP